MKKLILSACLFLATQFLISAQKPVSLNKENNIVCNDIIACKPGNQLNTAMNFMLGSTVSEPISDYDRYMKRSYNKNTGAWLLFSGGALCTVIGIITIPKDYDLFYNSKSTEKKFESASKVMLAGAVVMLSSIPLFVSAHRDKRKAQLIISNQKTGFGIPHSKVRGITGLTMEISLGRTSKTLLSSIN